MRKQTTFTMPGKIGDALHQWPVAFWWHRRNGKTFDLWLDKNTCAPLVPLFQAQPGVSEVTLREGIESYHCGGQPWQFNTDPTEHEGRQIVHLGFRAFPQRQITLQTFEDCPVKVQVDSAELAETPNLTVPRLPAANRLVVHGMGICPHNRQTPGVWKFLASVRREIEHRFDEIVLVGSPSDREVGRMAYPDWGEFDDGGDFLQLASYLDASRLVIACGSSVAALAGQLKVACIRVHDPIGDAPKVTWSNLGSNQLNATEFELRTEWRPFRDKVLEEVVV